MSDDARTNDETIPMVIEPTGQVTKLTTNRAMELLGDPAVEIDRLRARVAELETAGDAIAAKAHHLHEAYWTVGPGDPDVADIVEDGCRLADKWRAVRGER